MKLYNKDLSLLFLSFVFVLFSVLIYRFFVFKRLEVDKNDLKISITKSLNVQLDHADELAGKIKINLQGDKKKLFSNLTFPSANPYYIFKNKKLLFWSDNKFSPSYEYISGNYSKKYFYFRVGKFVVCKSKFIADQNEFEIFVFIPLTYRYPIKNVYIKPGINKSIFPFKLAIINNDPGFPGIQIYSKQEEYLFTVAIPNPGIARNPSALVSIIILSTLGFFCFLIFLISFFKSLLKAGKAETALLILIGLLVFLKVMIVVLNLPNALFEWELFNSKYFASSAFSPTLGDFLVNVLLITCFNFFLFFVYFPTKKFKSYVIVFKKRAWVSVLLILVSLFAYHQVYQFFLTINRHSQWIIDINQSISFNLFRLVSILIFVLIGLNYFIFLHIISRVFIYINPDKKRSLVYLLLSFAISALLYYYNLLLSWEIAIVHSLLFLIVVLFRLPKYLKNLRYETYIYYLIIAGVCSVAGALSIYHQDVERTIIQKNKFASQMINSNDVLAEYLLSEAQHKIENDYFIKSQFVSFFSSKELIEQKIKKVFLSNYFEKYDVKISLYDAQGYAINPFEEFKDYRLAAITFGRNEYRTEYKNLFFIQNLAQFDSKRYVVFNRITKNNVTVGFILLQLFNRKIIPNSVYPELLVDEKFGQNTNSKNFNYGIYFNNELVSSVGTINYDQKFNVKLLNNRKLYNEGLTDNQYHHLGIKEAENRILIISSSKYKWKDIFSNFSFLLLVFILFILLVLFFIALYFKFKRLSPNYSTKIQIYLNIAFFLPLFIVSITTLSIISTSHTETVQNSFEEKAESISKNISTFFDEVEKQDLTYETISNALNQLARYSDSDINFYNPEGTLIFSSQPTFFENGLLSKLVNPEAIVEIKEARKGTVLLSESLGGLNYNSVYVGVKDFDNGKLLGILSIPFYESKLEIENQIIDVLTTILNIFISIFIIFLILSYFASQLLTIPLKIITLKIKKTTLTQENEPLEWEAKDEIGLLIGEYNKMLVKLEQSKEALSKNEKEMAWREMARQVAHEIKNPLTPMKLTIQYLQKAFLNKDNDIANKIEKGLNTLLTQVDNLSEIATSFSLFAKMPIPKNDIVSVTQLLTSVTNLYNNSKEAVVLSDIPDKILNVNGDLQSLNGVFSNLIINGIQSVPSSIKPIIKVVCREVGDSVVISITDNGSGIPASIQDKIFVPNFSTKYSGSGIGLAVAKRTVEHFGGKIWFETELEKGTTFYIQLPII